MFVIRGFSRRSFAVSCTAVFIAVLGFGVGCNTSDYGNGPEPVTTTFYGVTADSSNVPGTIELSGVSYPAAIVPAAIATVRGGVPAPGPNAVALGGTLTFPGQAALTLTGYYDPDTDVIVFGCETPFYSFVGTVANGSATGASNGPNGQGGFVLVVNGTSGSSTTYCGTASCDTPDGCDATATFNLVVSGQLALVTATSNGTSAFGVGSVTGSTVSIDVVYETSLDLTIDGEISGSTVSGRWVDNTSGQAGPWSGDTASCTTPPGLRKK